MNSSNKQRLNKNISKWLIAGSLFFTLFFTGNVFAVSAEYTQSYSSDQKLYFGSLVSLEPNNESKITLANTENAKNFLGVYIDDGGSTLAVNMSDAANQVAVNGKVVALASNLNGDIKKGDFLAISTVSGVASKALASDSVIGSANTDFDENNPKNTRTEIINSDGLKREIVVGPIEIDLFKIQKNTSFQPGILQKLEQSIGKPISSLKLVLITLLSLAIVVAIASMSYAAIRTSIIQSSRNPLAQPVIMQSLAKTIFIIVLTGIIGFSLIYLVIRI